MTEPDSSPAPVHPGRGRGTHAAPPSPARLLFRSLLAVAVVAGLVALLVQLRGSPTTSTQAPGPAIVSPSAASTPTPTATATPTPALTHQAAPVTAAPTPKPSPTRVVEPLFVANNTREVGKAHRAATKFHAGGWPISGTGNYRGRQLSETTVFYPAGDTRAKAAAETLHRQFPSVKGVAPRFAGLPGHGLIVVLTAGFPA